MLRKNMFKSLRYYATASKITPTAKTETLNLNKISLTGRDLITPTSLTVEEMKSLLWTALDLKECDRQNAVKQLCLNARVSLVLQEPSIVTQFSVQNAAKLFNINLNTYVLGSENLGNSYEEFGYMLNSTSDMIICNIENQEHLEKIGDSASCSVVGIKTNKYNLVEVLSHLMTVQETFNYLRSIKFCYIGMPGALIDTYLTVLPRFCINLNYLCFDKIGGSVSPSFLQTGMKLSQENESELHEFHVPGDAITRAHVISTVPHNQEKFTIKEKHLKNAASNWCFLDTFPRLSEVECSIYTNKKSLVFKNMTNYQWIYGALMVRFLKNYNHETDEPLFDDYESGYQKYQI